MTSDRYRTRSPSSGLVSFLLEENVHALKDISMDVEPNTIHGVIGPSGAGKSTLIRIIYQIKERGHDFVNVKVYTSSPSASTAEELPEAFEPIISIFPSDRPRLLGVLEENGLITIDEDAEASDIGNASLGDLTDLFTSDYDITFEEVEAFVLEEYDRSVIPVE